MKPTVVFCFVTVFFMASCLQETMQIDPTYIDCANELNKVVIGYMANFTFAMVPPQSTSSPLPVTLTAQLVVVELHGIIGEEQKLSITTMIKLKWKDYRLATLNSGSFFGAVCSSANYSHWGYIVEAVNRIPWYPQWVISNGGDGVLQAGAWNYYPAIVHGDGTVEWTSMYHMETECILDVFYFPADFQKCNITVSWPTTDPNVVSLVVPTDHDGKPMPVVLHEVDSATASLWKLEGGSYVPNPEASNPSITFCLLLSRRSVFYIGAMMMQILLINCMVFCGMIMPPMAPKKVVVAFLNLTTVFLMNIGFYVFLPTTSDERKSPVVLFFLDCHTMFGLVATGFVCFISRIAEFREKSEEMDEIGHKKKNVLSNEQQAEEEIELAEDEWVHGSFIGGFTRGVFRKINIEKVNTYGALAYAIVCVVSYIVCLGFIYGVSATKMAALLATSYQLVSTEE